MTNLLSRIISVLGKKTDSEEYETLLNDLEEEPQPQAPKASAASVKAFRRFMLLAKNDTFCVATLKIEEGACELPVGIKLGDHRKEVAEKLGFKPLPTEGPLEADKDHYELNDVVLSLEFDADEKLCGARVWYKAAFKVRKTS